MRHASGISKPIGETASNAKPSHLADGSTADDTLTSRNLRQQPTEKKAVITEATMCQLNISDTSDDDKDHVIGGSQDYTSEREARIEKEFAAMIEARRSSRRSRKKKQVAAAGDENGNDENGLEEAALDQDEFKIKVQVSR